MGATGPGPLWPLMKHLVAALIMAYAPMRTDAFTVYNCTTISALVAAVEVIEGVNTIEAGDLLKKWSASVRSEFDTANAAAAGKSPMDNASVLSAMHTMIQNQAVQREDLRLAREEIVGMRQEHAQDRLEWQRTLAVALSVMEEKKVEPEPAGTASTTTTTTTSAAPAPAPAAPAPATSQPRMLVKRDMTSAAAKSAVTKNTKQPLLQEVLERLSRADMLRMASMGTLKYDLPHDAAIVKRTFKFVKTCITDAQWDVLIKPNVGSNEGRDALKDVCQSIQAAVEAKLEEHVHSKRAELNIVGISNRIKKRAGGETAWYTETPDAVTSDAAAREADAKPRAATGWGIFGLGPKK